MWVMVTMKGGATTTTTKALGETLSKSPSLSEWGQATSLHVEVPLVNQSMVECDQWPKVCILFLCDIFTFLFFLCPGRYSTRIKELGNWREAISVKRLGFMIKFFTTKCTYRCTMLRFWSHSNEFFFFV